MNPKPVSSTHRATPTGVRSIATPTASRKSAAPHELVTLRLPCLATRPPADARTRALTVLMLKVPAPSPPVPTTSTTLAPASTRVAASRMTSARPAISSGVSPFMRRAIAKPAICDGVASPSTSERIAARASTRDRSRPRTSFPSASLTLMPPPAPPFEESCVAGPCRTR